MSVAVETTANMLHNHEAIWSQSCLRHKLEPVATDGVITDTSQEQEKTEQEIRQLLSLYIAQPGKGKKPVLDISDLTLNRAGHIRWLTGILQPLPAPYTSLDASRPWLLYWVTHSLAIMHAALDPHGKQRAIDTIKSFWNAEEGGFGGGPGQMAHLAPTYASISALCYLDDGTGAAWEWIDRQAVHDWMLSLKQPDGSFVMHKGGEVDVRGCYCGLTVAVLLNILTPDLAMGTFDFIASCQTYEGGLASASHFTPAGSPALGEAHGGYTFCALASHFALTASPSLQASTSNGSPVDSAPPPLNPRALLRWASQMQGLPIEAGGFRGRSNKLVDGCYSWWCGGLFNILSALLEDPSAGDEQIDLFNRVGLQEYILIAAQGPHGGLRDKPGKGTDAYHSCYNLSGLSSAQHAVQRDAELRQELEKDWLKISEDSLSMQFVTGKNESPQEANARMRDVFTAALAWREDEDRKIVIGRSDSETDNEVALTHPVYNVVMDNFDKMMRWSYSQPPKVGLEELDSE